MHLPLNILHAYSYIFSVPLKVSPYQDHMRQFIALFRASTFYPLHVE